MPEEDLFNDEVDVAVDSPDNVTVNEYRSSVTVGEVETLDYGEDAYVTNVGTESDVVLDFGLPRGASGNNWGLIGGDLSDQTDLQAVLDAKDTAIAAKADANNAILTGTPTAPTAIDGTSTTQIATTAFVQNAITILNTSLQSYINTAVNNVLRYIDFSNMATLAITSTTSAQGTYTVPKNGYIKITSSVHGSDTCNYYIDNKQVSLLNEMLPIKANSVIKTLGRSSGSAFGSGYSIAGFFFPEAE